MWELRADHSVPSQITDRYLILGTELEDIFQSRSEREFYAHCMQVRGPLEALLSYLECLSC